MRHTIQSRGWDLLFTGDVDEGRREKKEKRIPITRKDSTYLFNPVLGVTINGEFVQMVWFPNRETGNLPGALFFNLCVTKSAWLAKYIRASPDLSRKLIRDVSF